MRSLQTHAESALNLAAAVCAAVIPIQHLQCGGSRKPTEQNLAEPSPEMLYAQYERTRRGRELSRCGVPGRPPLNGALASSPACGDSSERSSQRSSALSAMSTGRGRSLAAGSAAPRAARTGRP